MAKKNSAATRRAALRSQPEEDPEFQIAPMIDILLVLLVFFMSISSTEVLQKTEGITLPVAKDAKDAEHDTKGQTIINILWTESNNSGTNEIDKKTFSTADQTVGILQEGVQKNPKMRIL